MALATHHGAGFRSDIARHLGRRRVKRFSGGGDQCLGHGLAPVDTGAEDVEEETSRLGIEVRHSFLLRKCARVLRCLRVGGFGRGLWDGLDEGGRRRRRTRVDGGKV